MAQNNQLPENMTKAGNIIQQAIGQRRSDLDFSDLGIDGEERSCYSVDPFCQGPEYDFDEFH